MSSIYITLTLILVVCCYLGTRRLKSSSSKSSGPLYCPVIRPRPKGAYAMIATPSSRAVFRRANLSSSISRVNGEYSTCKADIGCTAWARRSVLAEHSEIPRYLTFPALRNDVSRSILWQILWCWLTWQTQPLHPRCANQTKIRQGTTVSRICCGHTSIGTVESARWR